MDCDVCPGRVEGKLCDLPLDVLKEIRDAGSTTIYRPRQILFGEGNRSGGLYLVCRGRVKLYQSDRFGRERVLEIAGQGSIVGELPLESSQTLSASAEAIEESQICFVSKEQLVPLIGDHPEVGVRLIEALSRELSIARRKVRDLVFKDAGTRLAGVLVDLARDEGAHEGEVQLRLDFTRAELAQRIGVSTETAIRLLRKLANRGVFDVQGRDLKIPDLGRLTRIARADELDEKAI